MTGYLPGWRGDRHGDRDWRGVEPCVPPVADVQVLMLAGQLAAVLVGGCLLGLAIYTAVYGYRPITRRQLADLKGRPLVHVTSQTAAAAMADPTGELWLDPRRARLPAVIFGRRPVLRLHRAVFVFSRSEPTRRDLRRNVRHRKLVTVITICGDHLQGTPLARLGRRRDGAIALLDGYRGPASLQHFDDTDAWMSSTARLPSAEPDPGVG